MLERLIASKKEMSKGRKGSLLIGNNKNLVGISQFQ